MRTKNAKTTKNQSKSSLVNRAAVFFGHLGKDAEGRRLLNEQEHRIEFDLSDGAPFYVDIQHGKIMVHSGSVRPRHFDANDVIHFQLRSVTLRDLFDGKMRFTDALIPGDQFAKDAMLLLECTLFKWSVLNWVGRLFRGAQLRSKVA